jgi:hypothetical protein
MRVCRIASTTLCLVFSLSAGALADTANAPASANTSASANPAATTATATTSAGAMTGAVRNPFDYIPLDSPVMVAMHRLAADGVIDHANLVDNRQRPLTRLEAAAIIARAYDRVKRLAVAGTDTGLSDADIADLRQIYEQLAPDISALDQRVTNVEQSMNEMKAKESTAFQISPEFRVQPVSFTQSTAGTLPNGKAAPSGTQFTRTGDASESPTAGTDNSAFTNYRLRLYLSGQPTPNVSFAGRIAIENNTNPAVPYTGTSTQYPAVTSTTFDYGYATYKPPKSGFSVSGGQLVLCCVLDFGTGTGWLVDSLLQGGALKYVSPNKNFTAWAATGSNAGYTFNTPGTFYYGQYTGIPHVTIGAIGTNQANRTVTEWYQGALRTNQTSIPLGGVIASWEFHPKWSITYEGAERFGNDPATGASWKDNLAAHAILAYGALAKPGDSLVELEYSNTGKNSLINNLSSYSFSDGPLGNLTNYVNNLQFLMVRYGFRFDKAGYVKLGYATSSLREPEFTANGDTLSQLNRNYFSLDTFFNF